MTSIYEITISGVSSMFSKLQTLISMVLHFRFEHVHFRHCSFKCSLQWHMRASYTPRHVPLPSNTLPFPFWERRGEKRGQMLTSFPNVMKIDGDDKYVNFPSLCHLGKDGPSIIWWCKFRLEVEMTSSSTVQGVAKSNIQKTSFCCLSVCSIGRAHIVSHNAEAT